MMRRFSTRAASLHVRMIEADRGEAVERDALDEPLKRPLHRFELP